MTEKILIPLDGSEYAEQVVPFLGELAKAGGFDVILLAVVNPDDFDVMEPVSGSGGRGREVRTGSERGMSLTGQAAGNPTGVTWTAPAGSPANLSSEEAEILDQANRSATEYLQGVEKTLEEMGVHADIRLGFGNPDSGIVEEAIMGGATIIAMSARSEMFWERGVLGSTTDRVLHASPMPVIVFKPMEGLASAVSVNPETVVIAVDGSPESEAGVDPAVKLAKEMGAGVALVHVLRRDSGRRREHAENYLGQLKKRIGGDVETSVASGKADDEVILFADQFPHPMIAVTEHGGISIGRWLRGSTTDKIIRNAGYPVLVIPSSK